MMFRCPIHNEVFGIGGTCIECAEEDMMMEFMEDIFDYPSWWWTDYPQEQDDV